MLGFVMLFFFLRIRRPPRSTRTDPLFPTRRSSDLHLQERSDIATQTLSSRGSSPGPMAAARGDGCRCLQPRQPQALETHDQCLIARIGQWVPAMNRSEEHTSELQSLMRISYAVFCLKKKT